MSIELDFSHPLAPDGWCCTFNDPPYGRELVKGTALSSDGTNPTASILKQLPSPYNRGFSRVSDSTGNILISANTLPGQSFTLFALLYCEGFQSASNYYLLYGPSGGNTYFSFGGFAVSARHDNGWQSAYDFTGLVTPESGDVYAVFYRKKGGTAWEINLYCIDGPNVGFSGGTTGTNNGSGFTPTAVTLSNNSYYPGSQILNCGYKRTLSDNELVSLAYNPWQIFKPAVGYVAVEPRSDTFRLLEIQGAPTETGIDITLVDSTGAALPNLSNLSWAWFDQSTIDSASTPTDVGNTGSTDGSGLLSLTLPNTTLTTGQTGMLALRDSTGMIYALYRVTI